MDSVTHIVLGAAIGEVALGKKIGRKGAIIGAAVATIPDLDVLLMPLYSPLHRISIHRGYSHSILFSLVAATLLMLLFRRKWIQNISAGRIWLFAWLALFTHMLLDTFTSYGTQLFLPFSDYRAGFDSITIVDPLYTLPLLIGVIFGFTIYKNDLFKRKWANRLGIIISSIYLLMTLANKTFINRQFHTALENQEISYDHLFTIPVVAANYKWYGVARNDEFLYIGPYSELGGNTIQFEKFPINNQLLDGLNERLVDRMIWFSKNNYTVAEYDGKIRVYNMQCDMQGVRTFGEYKAPTAWYYEITPHEDGTYSLTTGMHAREKN